MRKTHAMQIGDSVQDLKRGACDFLAAHFARHDNGEEIIGCVFHDDEVAVFLVYQVHGLDDVTVMQCRAYAEFRRDLFVVVAFGFVRVPSSELLHGKRHAVAATLHKPNRATGA